ncbi:hypothetical protein [Alkalibacillus silvisoli]|uniref:DUF2953 domain-containing protein n=1 Tax=Alkalibacillus silvisoli TaxID=392823 RepID=A0ABN0ZR61_9BACI
MVIVGGILIIILITVIFVLFTKVTVELMLTYENKQKDVYITVKWLNFKVFKRTIPVIDLNSDLSVDVFEKDEMLNVQTPDKEKNYTPKEMQEQYHIVQKVIDTTKDVIPHIKRLIESFHLHHFHWVSELGVKAANQTATLVGMTYSTKSMGCHWMTVLMKSDLTPQFKVIPNYNKPTLESELECILSIRIGQIMRNALSIAWQYQKIKRWNVNERTSNS